MTHPSAAEPPSGAPVELRLARADIGFSAAHFSVIDGVAERLHGHNYRVSLRARGRVDAEGTVVDFHVLKSALRDVCDELDERMLLPAHSPVVRVTQDGDRVAVDAATRHYVLPAGDVRLLPVVNTTCECLAAHLLGAVRARLGTAPVRLSLGVEELPGQGATVEE
ncbi:MAG: 6-carboxytetrahydropterin synthase [Candidatus Dormibacteraeota bacterium]|nr:6-carboxytetrahydropterin synthase [Candidatus Dormibacteraeota bacterium]MBV9525577.1 6-carboxytetrahydropterin synthase [Candidatus Dormibacteraeota bacterium]